MLALRLMLKDKGGKQHCLPFVGSNLGVEILYKAPQYALYGGFKNILCEACLFLIVFWL